MTIWLKLRLFLLVGGLGSITWGEMNLETTVPVWQKEIANEKLSCIPHLLKVKSNGEVVVVGTSLNIVDWDCTGHIWESTFDKKGTRLRDVTLKSATPNDCGAISDFWGTKGLDILDSNEIQLFIDGSDDYKQRLIRENGNRTIQKPEIKTQATGSDFFAGKMNRINAQEFLLFGLDKENQKGVLQKRNNRGDVIWERQYQYGSRTCITGIDQYKTHGLSAMTGWVVDDTDRSCTAWINIITDNGEGIAQDEFDIGAIDFIRVPEIAVVDDGNIAVVYNKPSIEHITSIKYRIYSPSLELQFEDVIYVCNGDMTNYGMAVIDGGFIVVYTVRGQDSQYIVLNQYDCNGTKIKGIKIDGIGTMGGDQVVVESQGDMVYIASVKVPIVVFPAKAVVTAVKVKNENSRMTSK